MEHNDSKAAARLAAAWHGTRPPHVVMVMPGGFATMGDEIADELHAAGVTVTRYPDAQSFYDDVTALGENKDILLAAGGVTCDRARMESAPDLRAIVSPITGTEGFDEDAARALGILVANGQVRENYESMAESTIMLILAALYDLPGAQELLRHNLPRPQPLKARMLSGKTLGLIGFGQIARAIVSRLDGWGVNILVSAPRIKPPLPETVRRVDLETLLATSDIVSVHAPLDAKTSGLLNAERLQLLKTDVVLINTARGGIIDDAALAERARLNPDMKVVLDVFETFPLPRDSPLRKLDNAILTPFLVGHTRETHTALPRTAVENIMLALAGDCPVHVRNPEILDAWRARWAKDR